MRISGTIFVLTALCNTHKALLFYGVILVKLTFEKTYKRLFERFFGIFAVFLISCGSLVGQNSHLAKIDLWEANKLNFNKYIYTNTDSCIKYARNMLEISDDTGIDSLIALSYWGISNLHLQRNEVDSALLKIDRAIKIAEAGNYFGIWLKSKNTQAKIYHSQNRYSTATNIFWEVFDTLAIDIDKVVPLQEIEDQNKADSLRRVYIVYSNMYDIYASIQKDKKNYDEALRCYRKINRFLHKVDLKEQIERVQCDIGEVYFLKGDIDNALKYSSIALEKSMSDNNYRNLIKAFLLQGDIYGSATDNYDKALDAYRNVLIYSEKIIDYKIETEAHLKIAEIYLKTDQEKKAYSYITKNVTPIVSTNTPPELAKTYYRIMTDIFVEQCKKDSSRYYYSLFQKASDSLTYRLFSGRISAIETEYRLREEEQNNRLLRARNANLALKSNSNRRMAFFVTVLAVLLIAVIVQMAIRFKDKKKRADELEKEVEKKAGEIRKANHMLQETNKRLAGLDASKSYFIGLINHEISTPLNGILGGAKLISAMLADANFDNLERRTETIAEVIETSGLIIESGERLRKLENISALIARLKSDTKYSGFSEVNISMLIDDIKTSYSGHFGNLTVKPVGSSVNLFVDQALIYKALVYVVDNAFKYSIPPGYVTVDCKMIDDSCEISIRDSGPGFSEQYLNEVFQPFAGDDLLSHSEGLGLSLSTCKIIMDYHGGSVRAENHPEGGAVVTLIFNLKNSETIRSAKGNNK